MISEQYLIISSFVAYTLDRYRNVLWLIILEGTYCASSLWALCYVINALRTLDTSVLPIKMPLFSQIIYMLPSFSLLILHIQFTFLSSQHSQQFPRRYQPKACQTHEASLLYLQIPTSICFVCLSVTPHVNYLCM
jgi:hypothetical protein